MKTEIDQREIKSECGQTAAAVRQDFRKVLFSLDVFSRFEETSAAECYVLVSKNVTTTKDAVPRLIKRPQSDAHFFQKLLSLRSGLREAWSPDNSNNLY